MTYASYPSLNNKSVFITGGATGIGASLVAHFAEQGARVGFIDINDAAARDVVSGAGGRAAYQHCDVRDVAALQAAIAAFAEGAGVDVLINNAASDERHVVADVDVADWDNRMNLNLRPHFFAAQGVRPAMARAGGGSIINLSSTMVQMAAAGAPVYVAAKAAIHGLTRALARELGPDRIRVNSIVPGWILTERQIRLYMTDEGEKRRAAAQCIPDRLGPEDIARMALFLAADDSRHCTAQSFIVDGGWV